jgi:hypothetical protein
MHRGRNRSRKPVESKSASPAPQSSTATHDTAPLQPLAHGLSLGGAASSQLRVDDASSYGTKYVFFLLLLSAIPFLCSHYQYSLDVKAQ